VGARESLTATAAGGTLGGWVAGDGVEVLLLHGGPGLSYNYLDGVAAELGAGYRTAAFQQRGLEPSTVEGPFTVAQSVQDVVAVLDALQWRRAYLVGHSWGGYLALCVAGAHPDRLHGALAIDPPGVVGDGGAAAFEAEIIARTPKERRDRARALDERAMASEGSPEDGLESLELIWPSYFADPDGAPPMPPMRMCVAAYGGIMADVAANTEDVAAALVAGGARYGVIAGAGSPIPWGIAARATVELSPSAFLVLVPNAGHFPWLEAPGSVRGALERLVAGSR
jgi:pimeloyl-ACP methyl ester carboxylesterase